MIFDSGLSSLELSEYVRGHKYYEEVLRICDDFKSLTYILEDLFPEDMKYSERVSIYESKFLPLVNNMRGAIFDRMSADREFRKLIKFVADSDVHFWINLYGFTYNPIFDDDDVEFTPMILFKYQLDFINRILDGESLIVIKGRGLGFTWVKVFLDLWELQKNGSNYQAIVISRVEEDLDFSGDLYQTIFGRMRFVSKFLPYKINVSGKTRLMRVEDAQFLGKSSNPDSARSTRAKRVYIEEAGVIEKFDLVLRAVNAVSKQRIIGGSVAGTSNGFFGYWEAANESKETDGKKSAYGVELWLYKNHPLFSAPDWLELERANYGDDEAGFRQEVLVDWFASVTNQIFVKLKRSHLVSFSREDFNNFSNFEQCCGIDVGFGSSPTSIWYYYYDVSNNKYFYIGYDELKDSNYKEVANTIKMRGFEHSTCFVDEHSNKRGNDGLTLTYLWEQEGLNIVTVSNKNIGASCQFGNVLLGQGLVVFDKSGFGISEGFDKLSRYRFVDGYNRDKQDKNEASDAGDSFRYSHKASSYFKSKSVKNTSKYDVKDKRGNFNRVKRRR